MKLARLSGVLLLSLLAFCCQKRQPTTQRTPAQRVISQPEADALVRDTVRGKDGIALVVVFNNTRQTATFILKGRTIDLRQDTVASGIQYSNSVYEYREHQGEISLKKNGKIIFSAKR